MTRKVYQPWEIAFIQLTYPVFKNREIAKYLNGKMPTICDIANRLGIKKSKKIYIGQKFDRLEIIEYMGVINSHSRWLCKCDCGNIKKIKAANLLEGTTRSCGCLLKEIKSTGYKGVTGTYLGIVKGHMKERGYKKEIDIKYIADILEKQNYLCALTNLPIEVNTTRSENKNGKKMASLDRVNSSQEYIDKNCQWLFKDINRMKWDLDQDYFIYLCHLVAQKNPCPLQYQEELEEIRKTIGPSVLSRENHYG